MKKPLLILCALFGVIIAGCSGGADTTATKTEETSFRNPSKTPPAEAKPSTGPPAGATTAGG